MSFARLARQLQLAFTQSYSQVCGGVFYLPSILAVILRLAPGKVLIASGVYPFVHHVGIRPMAEPSWRAPKDLAHENHIYQSDYGG